MTCLSTKENILIDNDRNVRLADFSLLTVVQSSSSHGRDGTGRWMSPELIDPEPFGLEKICRTESSDCYALGMVIYQTISGLLPFHKDTGYKISKKVEKGERPPRMLGFTDTLWKMVESCWAHQPTNRPSIEDVLRCLKTPSNLPGPFLPLQGEETEEGSDGDPSGGASTSRDEMSGPKTTETNTSTAACSSHVANRGLGSVASLSRPSAPLTASDDSMDHGETDPGFPIPGANPGDGGYLSGKSNLIS